MASGLYSHAGGIQSYAKSNMSFAHGMGVTSEGAAETVIGYFNELHGVDNYNMSYAAFVIGNGMSENDTLDTFAVSWDGDVYAAGVVSSSGADYAEYFEWEDGNSDKQDRVGYFVTLRNGKISIASPIDDYILGAVAVFPSVVGNSFENQWKGRVVRDKWGRPQYEYREIKEEKNGEIVRRGDFQIINPDYDATKKYIPRSQRSEWSPIGMFGVLKVRDDGTCLENGYCKVANGGIATAADQHIPGQTWRVVNRITDNIIMIVFR